MARRILIVEDDKHFASQLAELMEFQGLVPVTQHSGPAGIEAFRTEAIDLVLLDVMLPNVHGIRVLEAIRGLPRGDDVPVLLMSAVYRSEALFAADIRRLGVSGFLSKPFSLLELGRRIETLLESPGAGRDEVRTLLQSHRPAPAAPAQTPAAASDVPAAAFPGSPRPAEPAPPSDAEIPAILRKAPPTPTAEDSIVPVDTGRRLPQVGELSPAQYVRILATLFHAHSSGRFILDGARGRRTFFLLNGYPVWVESTDPMNGLPRHLHESGALSANDLAKLAGWLATRRGSIRSGLVELGLVKAADLPALMESWVTAEVRDGLGESGSFEFHAGDDFAGTRPVYEVNPVRAICSGLEQHVALDDADTALSELDGRLLGRTRTFNRLYGYVGTSTELRELGEFLLRPRSLAEIRGRFGEDNAAVKRTLWFLVHAGLVALSDSPQPARTPTQNRRSRQARSVPGAPLKTPRPSPPADLDTRRISRDVVAHVVEQAQLGRRPGAQVEVEVDVDDLASQIVRDYVTRIDLDHYGFLGVERTATAAEIDAAYHALAPRYRLRNLGAEMQGDVRRQAKELLARLVQAFDELSSPNRRGAYDATLAMGTASPDRASTEPSQAPVSAGDAWYPGRGVTDYVARQSRRLGNLEADKFERAVKRMASGDFGGAYSVLEELRARYPSDGAILASLGWCRHAVAPGDARGLDKALEWVDLALAFQPDDALSLEARARILHATGDERAGSAVKRLFRHQPRNMWAKLVLTELSQQEDTAATTRSGVLRSLWGKRR